jgi:hypothetical protein
VCSSDLEVHFCEDGADGWGQPFLPGEARRDW